VEDGNLPGFIGALIGVGVLIGVVVAMAFVTIVFVLAA